MGFDWPGVSGVIDKVKEELAEIENEIARNDLQAARRELGDLFLITVNLARFLEANPETVLREATDRFSARFEKVKRAASEAKINMKKCTLDELDQLWAEAKNRAK